MTDPATYVADDWPGEGPTVLSEPPPSRCRLRDFDCPLAEEGDRCYRCAPEEFLDLHRLIERLRDGHIRCLILELPTPDYGLTLGDLREWARRLRERLPDLTVRVAHRGAAHLCGDQPACRGCALDEVREFNAAVGRLDINDRTFRAALTAHLPNLSAVMIDIFHGWCVRSEPGKPGKAITQETLAKQMRCSERTVRRALTEVKAAAPKIYRQFEVQRGMRAQETHGYVVGGRADRGRRGL